MTMHDTNSAPAILIVEDDADQIDLLALSVLTEIKELIDDPEISAEQATVLNSVKILKVSDIELLEKTVATKKNILLALVDCNIPDAITSAPHDQLVKTNHVITGQHKSVDIISEALPDTPITIISSMDRFRLLVSRYYQKHRQLDISFISKRDQESISKHVSFILKVYLGSLATKHLKTSA